MTPTSRKKDSVGKMSPTRKDPERKKNEVPGKSKDSRKGMKVKFSFPRRPRIIFDRFLIYNIGLKINEKNYKPILEVGE